MSDLSRSLVDAAAEAIASAYAPGDSAMLADPCYWRVEGERAVAAVLETLAASGAALEDHDGDWQAALRGLAAEVKEPGGG